MRNLKKVLCLVLSLAMMLSVMVMGTGAVYTDQASIKNTEAVDVLTALNVLDGYTDGSFRPTKVVTRAEMAKIICVVLNGGKEPVFGKTEVPTFSDMNGHWALEYVEYCVARHIIDGFQDGTFRPNQTVTGTQAAKMLLAALDYDPAVFGYVGNNWAINVNVDAAKAGLYEDLETIDPAQGMLRDNVAQMVYNMLGASTMNKAIDRYTSSGEIVYKYEEGPTAMEKYFGSNGASSGILVNIYYNKDTKEYTYITLSANWFDKNGLPGKDGNGIFDWNVPIANMGDMKDYVKGFTSKNDYSDLFGQNVSVLANASGKIYGLYPNKGGVVASGVWADVEANYNGYNNDYSNTVKLDGVKYRLDNVAKNLTDLKVVGYNQFNDDFYADGQFIADRVLPQYSYTAIDIDGGGDIDLFVVYPYYVMKSVKTTSDFFRVDLINDEDGKLFVGYPGTNAQDETILDMTNNPGNLLLPRTSATPDLTGNRIWDLGLDCDVEWDDVEVNGNLTSDSYLQAIPARYTARGEDIFNVLTVKTDVATAMKSADMSIKLGGVWQDGLLLQDEDNTYPAITAFGQLSVGSKYNYVEVNSFLFLIDDAEGSGKGIGDYVVVTAASVFAAGTIDNYWQANLLTTEGKTIERANIKLAPLPAALLDENGDPQVTDILKTISGIPQIGWLYTCEANKDGSYTLTPVMTFETDLDDDGNVVAPDYGFKGIYDAYMIGAPLNEGTYLTLIGQALGLGPVPSLSNMGMGVPYLFDSDDAGTYFEDTDVDGDGDVYMNGEKCYIADDAVIFVYNTVDNTYSVISGKDLKEYDNDELWDSVDWAFSAGNDMIELAYVALPFGAGVSVEYAYIDNMINRTAEQDGTGDWFVSFDAVTAPNEKTTFETRHQDVEDTWLQQDAYDLDEGDMVKLIMKDGKVVDIIWINEDGAYGTVDGDPKGTTGRAANVTDAYDVYWDGDEWAKDSDLADWSGYFTEDATVIFAADGDTRTSFTEIKDGDFIFFDYYNTNPDYIFVLKAGVDQVITP